MEDYMMNNIKKEKTLRNLALATFFFYAILAYLDVISVLVPTVLILDGVAVLLSLIFDGYYIYVKHSRLKLDLPFMCFYVFALFTCISMVVKHGDIDRDAAALFCLVQMPTIIISVYVLKNELGDVLKYLSFFVVIFSFIVLTLSFDIFAEERGGGITGGPNLLGSLIAFTVLCICYLEFSLKKNSIKFVLVFDALYMIAGLYKTDSRTAQICLIVGVFLFVSLMILNAISLKKRILISLVIVVFALICGLMIAPRFLVSRAASASVLSGREVIWKDSLRVAGESLLLGYGGNSSLMNEAFRNGSSNLTIMYAKNHFLHNIYLQVLVEYGIVALISLVIMLIAIIVKYIVAFFRGVNFSTYMLFFFVIMVTCLLHGIAESCLLYFGGVEQFMFCISIAGLYLLYVNPKLEK